MLIKCPSQKNDTFTLYIWGTKRTCRRFWTVYTVCFMQFRTIVQHKFYDTVLYISVYFIWFSYFHCSLNPNPHCFKTITNSRLQAEESRYLPTPCKGGGGGAGRGRVLSPLPWRFA
jgi:hypothetical protein